MVQNNRKGSLKGSFCSLFRLGSTVSAFSITIVFMTLFFTLISCSEPAMIEFSGTAGVVVQKKITGDVVDDIDLGECKVGEIVSSLLTIKNGGGTSLKVNSINIVVDEVALNILDPDPNIRNRFEYFFGDAFPDSFPYYIPASIRFDIPILYKASQAGYQYGKIVVNTEMGIYEFRLMGRGYWELSFNCGSNGQILLPLAVASGESAIYKLYENEVKLQAKPQLTYELGSWQIPVTKGGHEFVTGHISSLDVDLAVNDHLSITTTFFTRYLRVVSSGANAADFKYANFDAAILDYEPSIEHGDGNIIPYHTKIGIILFEGVHSVTRAIDKFPCVIRGGYNNNVDDSLDYTDGPENFADLKTQFKTYPTTVSGTLNIIPTSKQSDEVEIVSLLFTSSQAISLANLNNCKLKILEMNPSASNSTVVVLKSGRYRVTDVTINGGGTALSSEDSTSLYMKDCAITGVETGIETNNSTGIDFEYNSISASICGMNFKNRSVFEVDYCTITPFPAPMPAVDCFGIRMADYCYGKIRYNSIQAPNSKHSSYGIYADTFCHSQAEPNGNYPDPIVIYRNIKIAAGDVDDPNGAYSAGVAAWNSSYLALKNNLDIHSGTVYNGSSPIEAGVLAMAGGNLALEANNIFTMNGSYSNCIFINHLADIYFCERNNLHDAPEALFQQTIIGRKYTTIDQVNDYFSTEDSHANISDPTYTGDMDDYPEGDE